MGDDLVMMNGASGVYLNLTGVGGHIWKLLEQPMRMAELCAALEAEYDAGAERIEREVREFVERLRARGAVRLDVTTVA
jgi:hypothetical protein